MKPIVLYPADLGGSVRLQVNQTTHLTQGTCMNQPQTELRITKSEIVARGGLAVLIVGALLLLPLAFSLLA